MSTFYEILKTLKDWIEVLAPFGVVGGLLWKFWLKKRYEEGKELYSKINVIASEFRPNGGSSLRDAINRIEQKVTIQEQKVLAFVKSSPMGTWLSDENGKCSDVNKSICRIFGRTESEIKGDNWINWIHPTIKDDVVEEWIRCVNSDMNFDMEYSIILPNKKIQLVHAVAYQIKDMNGKLLGFLGTLNVIGDPK